MMPAVFGVAALIGLDWLQARLGHGPVFLALWWTMTPAFVIATGWYDAQFSARVRKGKDKTSDRVGEFFMIQVLLTPLLWALFIVLSLVCGWIKYV